MGSRSIENETRFQAIFRDVQKRKIAIRVVNMRRGQQLEWIAEYKAMNNNMKGIEAKLGEMFEKSRCQRPELTEDVADTDEAAEKLSQELDQDMKQFYLNEEMRNETADVKEHDKHDQGEPAPIADVSRKWEQRREQLDQVYQDRHNDAIETLRSWGNRKRVRALAKSGGWDEHSHNIFLKINNAYFNKKRGRQQLMARLKLELPNSDLEDIQLHLEWFEKYKAFCIWCKDHKAAWKRELERCDEDMASEYKHAEEYWQQECERAREKQEFDRHRESVKKRLSDLRVKWERRIADVEERERSEDEERKKKDSIKMTQDRRHQAANRLLIEQFRAEKAEQAAAEERILKEIDRQQREAMEMMAGINQERVEYRECLRKERVMAREATMAAAMAEVEAREKRLEAIRRLVEVDVGRDHARALQHTISSEMRSATGSATNPDQNPFLPVFGYSTDALMKDTRFALSVALNEAGLYNTQYAHDLIKTAAYYQP